MPSYVCKCYPQLKLPRSPTVVTILISLLVLFFEAVMRSAPHRDSSTQRGNHAALEATPLVSRRRPVVAPEPMGPGHHLSVKSLPWHVWVGRDENYDTKSLRAYRLSDSDDAHWYKQQERCAICTADFEVGETVRELPCRHIFHAHEVDEWLIKRTRTCPTCMAVAAPKNGTGFPRSGPLWSHDGPAPPEYRIDALLSMPFPARRSRAPSPPVLHSPPPSNRSSPHPSPPSSASRSTSPVSSHSSSPPRVPSPSPSSSSSSKSDEESDSDSSSTASSRSSSPEFSPPPPRRRRFYREPTPYPSFD